VLSLEEEKFKIDAHDIRTHYKPVHIFMPGNVVINMRRFNFLAI